MKISQIFSLNKSQAELDFVDIDIEKDYPLFIDPFFIGMRTDRWSIEATRTIKSFFQEIVDLIRDERIDDARQLFRYLGENNANCLGLSKGNPQGTGVGNTDTNKILDRLIQSRAIETGLVQDIEDNILFVEKFGKDKLSDMTTNIIALNLIEYTKSQCKLHNIPMTQMPSGFYWDIRNRMWVDGFHDMLFIDGHKIFLVPKGIVSFCKRYTPDKYYNFFVLNFLQNEELRMPNSLLVKRRRDGTKYVTKKDLKVAHPFSKDFLRSFTNNYPDVLRLFKERTIIDPILNYEITDIEISNIANQLISRLESIPLGAADANNYHKLTIGILELLFYPNLISPIKEDEIHEGRKRIDITYENAAKSGIFKRLHEIHHIPCPYIYVECKNYTRDIANPELDQIAGRFSFMRGQVGLILCRRIENMPLFIQRCKDTFNDGRGLIIPIEDADLIELLHSCNNFNMNNTESFLSERVRNIVMG